MLHFLAAFRVKKEEKSDLCARCVQFLWMWSTNGTFTFSFKCAYIPAELKTRSKTRTRTSTPDKTGRCRQISMWAAGFQEKTSHRDKTKRSSRAAGGGSFNQSFTLQTAQIGSVLLRRTFRFSGATHRRKVFITHPHSSHTAFAAGV